MKKTLLSLFAVALAANIQAADPILLSVFVHTTDMPTAGDARFGTGFEGKVFTVDKANKQVVAWDAEGKAVYAQDDSFAGVAITCDDAGNILVSNGFNNAASAITLTLAQPALSTVTEIEAAEKPGDTFFLENKKCQQLRVYGNDK